jgi:AraC family transcriptional regulator of adaptative response / DNA-3-methyladenine glycosylase II
VALASGYGSIRRFNAAFLSSYGRSPSELRKSGRPSRSSAGLHAGEANGSRSAHTGADGGEAHYNFQLKYRPPFDWEAHLSFLRPRGIPGVESTGNEAYRRTVRVGGNTGFIEVRDGGPGALRVEIHIPDPSQLLRIVSRVRAMFDLDADPSAIDAHLSADPLLRPLVRKRAGMRVPGAWDGFELGVRAILGQQVSVAAATTLAGRLVERLGDPVTAPDGSPGMARGVSRPWRAFPLPETLATATIADLGVPGARAGAIRCFAAAVAGGEIRFDGSLDGETFRRRITGLPGIGPWTAEYIALRALGDPDAFPGSDLGLLRATGSKTPRQLLERARAWQPWRAYAALHLWASGRVGG